MSYSATAGGDLRYREPEPVELTPDEAAAALDQARAVKRGLCDEARVRRSGRRLVYERSRLDNRRTL